MPDPIDLKKYSRERDARERRDAIRTALAGSQKVAGLGIVAAAVAVVALQDYGFWTVLSGALAVVLLTVLIVATKVLANLARTMGQNSRKK